MSTTSRRRTDAGEELSRPSGPAPHATEEQLRLLLDGVKDHAIFMLDPDGTIATWSPAAQRLKGWSTEEAVGRHFSMLFPREDVVAGKPRQELERALAEGRCEVEGWRMRKDGSRFWANVVITPLHDEAGRLRGFAKVTRDLSERRRAEDELRAAKERAEAANRELESFSYSISHDLRAPLRSIDGFSKVLLEDYGPQLDERGKDYLGRVRAGAQRMGRLIDDVLRLSRVSRAELLHEPVDLSALAREIVAERAAAEPGRPVRVLVHDGMTARADPALLRQALANLVDNAFKFTSRAPDPAIEIGAATRGGCLAYFVRDNGVGFDPAYASKLFGAFQRLHGAEFPGTGIGLAIVQRVVGRHGGEVWADASPGAGATFWFTLGCERAPS